VRRLDEIIRDALELEADVEMRSLSYRVTPGWDSVAHYQLLAALEAEYEFIFEPDELMAMTDYEGICRVIERRNRDAER
jgi:acyl carrier protein